MAFQLFPVTVTMLEMNTGITFSESHYENGHDVTACFFANSPKKCVHKTIRRHLISYQFSKIKIYGNYNVPATVSLAYVLKGNIQISNIRMSFTVTSYWPKLKQQVGAPAAYTLEYVT